MCLHVILADIVNMTKMHVPKGVRVYMDEYGRVYECVRVCLCMCV